MKQTKYEKEEIIAQRVLLSQKDIGLTGVANARELGGYVNTGGMRVKQGCLIRSGQLRGATASDVRILQEKYRVGLVIDLRTPGEAAMAPDPMSFGAKYVNLPVLDDNGNEEAELYSRVMFGESATAAYKRFFRLLIEHEEERAVLFHGTHGNVRTGVAAALLLTLLGVPEEIVIEDYLLSNKTNCQTAQPDGEQTADAAYPDGRKIYDKLYAHTLRRLFSVACLEYGSVKEYLQKSCGLKRSDISELKYKYLK